MCERQRRGEGRAVAKRESRKREEENRETQGERDELRTTTRIKNMKLLIKNTCG